MKGLRVFTFITLCSAFFGTNAQATPEAADPCIRRIYSVAPFTPSERDWFRSITTETSTQLAGGITGGGGGWGVSCPAPQQAPTESRSNETRGLRRPRRQPRQAQPAPTTLETLDLWEVGGPRPGGLAPQALESPLPGEDASTFARRLIRDKLGPYAPYFARRIEEALARVHVETPIPQNRLVNARNDVGTLRRPLNGCELLPIAWRYSTRGPDGKPVGFVDMIPERWARLNIENQAALLLHEAIYLLENELGQVNSARTRRLVSHLMTPWNHFDHYPERYRRYLLSTELYESQGFVDYFRLFLPPVSAHAQPSSLTRQHSFFALHAASRASNIYTNFPEMSFLRTAETLGGFNSDLPNVQELFLGDPDERQKLEVMCQAIADRPEARQFSGIRREALQYCETLRKQN